MEVNKIDQFKVSIFMVGANVLIAKYPEHPPLSLTLNRAWWCHHALYPEHSLLIINTCFPI